MKSTVRLTGKEARIPAAKHISAQLAGQLLKRPATVAQQSTPTRNDDDSLAEKRNRFDEPQADSAEASSPEGSNSDSEPSSTEPDSDDEEHQLWEERQRVRKEKVERRQERKHAKEERLWAQEIHQEREHQEAVGEKEHQDEKVQAQASAAYKGGVLFLLPQSRSMSRSSPSSKAALAFRAADP